jgi:high frequency lysogenization protein
MCFSRDAEVDRYFEAINVLVKNMNKNTEIFSNLRDELSNHKEDVTEDNLHEHAEFLSNLYLKTISKINPRIIVNGDNIHLTDNKNASMIRALLLSAIRSFILWQQSGGTNSESFSLRKKWLKLHLQFSLLVF